MDLSLPLILASQSPRRRRLLERLGLSFAVQVSPAEEIIPENASPSAVVEHLAREKAEAVAMQHPEALTLAADTIVVFDDEILGKPETTDAARHMLRRLSGTTHTVLTGLALFHPAGDQTIVAHESTAVTFGRLSDDEIEAYVATESPMDKAGSYGIQDDTGALFVERIEGDYYNVVGLPLRRFYVLLRTHFERALHL